VAFAHAVHGLLAASGLGLIEQSVDHVKLLEHVGAVLEELDRRGVQA
jgi:hypothetical protein